MVHFLTRPLVEPLKDPSWHRRTDSSVEVVLEDQHSQTVPTVGAQVLVRAGGPRAALW